MIQLNKSSFWTRLTLNRKHQETLTSLARMMPASLRTTTKRNLTWIFSSVTLEQVHSISQNASAQQVMQHPAININKHHSLLIAHMIKSSHPRTPKEKKMVRKTGAPFTYHTIRCCAMFFFWFYNVSYKKSIAQVAKPKRFESIKPPNSSSLGNLLGAGQKLNKCCTSLNSNGQFALKMDPCKRDQKGDSYWKTITF